LFDVPNRGNRLALATFNRVPRPINPSAPTDAGDGFLMRHGTPSCGAAGSTYWLSVADNAREEVELLNSDG
jgi:hypothetical protein